MNKYKKGAATTDLLIYFAVSSFLVIVIWGVVYRPLSLWIEQERILNTIGKIENAVNIKLKKDFHKYGFMAVAGRLDDVDLISNNLLDRNLIGNWRFIINISASNVQKSKTTKRWSHPTRMEIEAIPNDKGFIEKFNFGENTRNTGVSFVFIKDINIDVFNFNYFDPSSGGYANLESPLLY